MTTRATRYFDDPFDPARSLQLNNRYWKDERYQHLDDLRAAEDDINHRRMSSLRKTLRPVKALLPPRVRRSFVSRIVYSMVYRVVFEPIRFKLELSEDFIRANSYSGTADEAYMPAKQTEELRHIVDLIHSIYRRHYGHDVMSSDLAVRYIDARNKVAVTRMTAHGEFSDFHLDEGKDFTCILYLCPVTHENGCFTYIDGSSAVRKSHLLRAAHQVVDCDLGLSSAPPEARSHLPLEFRGSMRIGDYLDEAKVEKLRDSVVEMVGKPGEGIIFNGFDTMHRGGKPLSGARTALFISTRGHFTGRMRRMANDLMARLWL